MEELVMGLFNNFFGSKKRKDVVDNNKLNKKVFL